MRDLRSSAIIRWLAVLLLSTVASAAYAQFVGDPLPAFDMRDTSGGPVTTADFAGGVWILNVWASWCPPCRAELALLDQAYRDLERAGLRVLLLNAGESAELAERFLAAHGVELRSIADQPGAGRDVEATVDLLRRLRSRGLPTTYFIDADLVIRDVYVGELSIGALRERLARLGLDWTP